MDRGVSIISATIAPDAAGWRLDRALAAALPTISRERLKALISSGEVKDPAGSQVRDPAAKALPGATYEIRVPEPKAPHNEPQDIALEIVVRAEGSRIVLDPELKRVLLGQTSDDDIAPRAAAAWLIHCLVSEGGGRVQVADEQEGMLLLGALLPA